MAAMEVILDLTPLHLVVKTLSTGVHLEMAPGEVINCWELPRDSIIKKYHFEKHLFTVLSTKSEWREESIITHWQRYHRWVHGWVQNQRGN